MESHIVFCTYYNIFKYKCSDTISAVWGSSAPPCCRLRACFRRLAYRYFFSVGRPGGGVRAVVIYSMHVWRRRGALDPCNSGMFMLCLLNLVACMIAIKITDLNANLHALYIINHLCIIIRPYSTCKRGE